MVRRSRGSNALPPKGQVTCPPCKGKGCKMCHGIGYVYETTAKLWLDVAKLEGWVK